MRILLTERCNAACYNCFNAAVREHREISVNDFISLCTYLQENGVSSLKIMGGEPTVHTEFVTCMTVAQRCFPSVILFTNAVNDEIKRISIRRNDCITYNFHFIDEEFDVEKFRFDQPGRRGIEVQIASDTNVVRLKERIHWLAAAADMKRRSDIIRFNLTLNCMENIFDNQNVLIEKWNDIADYITDSLSLVFDTDHRIPKCVASRLHMTTPGDSLCSLLCAGLIDAGLYLRFCNQYSNVLLYMKRGNGWTDFIEVRDALKRAFRQKLKLSACENCAGYPTVCNGGCFGHKCFKSGRLYEK